MNTLAAVNLVYIGMGIVAFFALEIFNDLRFLFYG